MTGFLQRLAERATGAAHPLRAVFSPLFAPSLAEEVQKPVDAMNSAHVDAAQSTIGQAWAKPVQPGQNRPQAVSDKSHPPSETASKNFVHAADHAVAVEGRAAIEKSGEAALSQSASMMPPTLRPPALRPPALMPPALMPPAPTAIHSPAIDVAMRTEPPFQTHQEAGLEQTESLRPAPVTIAIVEPLLPLAQPAREPFRPTSTASNGNPGRSAGLIEETTEVHVHIGRIEVTAMHEPAPAKPAAARRPAPMSLDDYLAKRHGGRP